MRFLLVCTFLLLESSFLLSQDRVEGVREHLADFKLGTEPASLYYYADSESFHTPGSPFVDRDGRILFFLGKRFVVWEKNRIYQIPYGGDLELQNQDGGHFFSSQHGITVEGQTAFLFGGNKFYDYDPVYKDMSPDGFGYYSLPTPFGAIVFSTRERRGLALEFDSVHPNKEFSVINSDALSVWLNKQPGGYKIGPDNFLYHNGALISPKFPLSEKYTDWVYVGELGSGHTVWCSSPAPEASVFSFASPEGLIELALKVPTSPRFTYGLGPMGEFYYLFAPEMDKKLDPLNDYYTPEPGSAAELVVVRNHLKYFGRLNDGGVRLRKDPTTTGEILGTYPVKTGFRILETGTVEETIGGQKNVWYKVRLLDGKEGWFFGSFVQNLYDGPNGKAPPWPNVPDW